MVLNTSESQVTNHYRGQAEHRSQPSIGRYARVPQPLVVSKTKISDDESKRPDQRRLTSKTTRTADAKQPRDDVAIPKNEFFFFCVRWGMFKTLCEGITNVQG